MLEPLGTNGFMREKPQVKFYCEKVLADEIAALFKQQGLSLSTGLSRLMLLLKEAPEELRPILLGQAPGNAAQVLAAYVLARVSHESVTAHAAVAIVGQLNEQVEKAAQAVTRQTAPTHQTRRKQARRGGQEKVPNGKE
jgi:hypothetical protein